MSGRTVAGLCGALIGVGAAFVVILNHIRPVEQVQYWPVWVAGAVMVSGLIGFALVSFALLRPYRLIRRVIGRLNIADIVAAVIGLTLGLFVAALFTIPLSQIHEWSLDEWLPTTAAVVFGFLGVMLAVSRRQDFVNLAGTVMRGQEARRAEREERAVNSTHRYESPADDSDGVGEVSKYDRQGRDDVWGGRRSTTSGRRAQKSQRILLDASSLIDGRIADIAQTGFIMGTLVVPQFVLRELQHIAAAPDDLPRARGGRGLEVIARLERDQSVAVEISDADVKAVDEIDAKLVKLAQRWHCPIITGDFSLNQVATLQGVNVLNVNELAHAVKPILLPGEETSLQIIKEGKESGQGVGYLEDGTMIVVHGGKPYIGKTMNVIVTRALQTIAGRMVFAQPKAENDTEGVHSGATRHADAR